MRQASNAHEQEIVAREIEHLEEQIRKAERRLDNLLDMRANQEIDRETYATKSQKERQALDRHRCRSGGAAIQGRGGGRHPCPAGGPERPDGAGGKDALDGRAETGDPEVGREADRHRGAVKSGAKFARGKRRQDPAAVGGPVADRASDYPGGGRRRRNATRRNVGPHGGQRGRDRACGGVHRTGQLRTTSSDCAPLAGADDEVRAGHLDPSFLCSVRRGRARR
jgi:hypothetical protein